MKNPSLDNRKSIKDEQLRRRPGKIVRQSVLAKDKRAGLRRVSWLQFGGVR